MIADAETDLKAISFLANPDSSIENSGVLHALFEKSARLHASRTAVECRGERLSYEQLEAKANQFARYLQTAGLKKGDRICLLFHKSFEAYIALLGILKAGAAYVPLDPSYPEERLRFIAQDSQAAALVTSLEFFEISGGIDIKKIFFGEVQPDIDAQERACLPLNTGPEDEAYVIYTSGTTGKPKGVRTAHRNVYHLVLAEQKVYAVVPEDRVLQGFSLAFDASVEEIWIAFNAGATLVAGTEEVMHAGPEIGGMLSGLNITVLSCVPTLLSMFSQAVPSVRLLILGGEALAKKLLEPWFSPSRRIYNTYGPTETTVIATLSLCRAEAEITIGTPIANYTACIMDEQGAIVRRGGEGELVIGGYGVAQGYLNREQLTKDRFIENRHSSVTEDRSPVLYRTGDLARVNADGDIEYLGRIDTQVKIRGFRVELAEIEALLLQRPGVKNAAVVVQEIGGNSVLCAYVILSGRDGFDTLGAVADLKNRLPPYMVPSFVEPLADFPKLSNGKLDRKSFPIPRRRAAAAAREFSSPVKKAIHDRWGRLFGNDDISESDNFFSELGGHSLLAAQFVSGMRADPRYAGLSMRDLYAHPSIEALADYLERMATPSPHEKADETSFAPVYKWKYNLSAVVQGLMLYFVVALFALQWVTPFAVYSFFKAYEHPFWESLLASLLSLCGVYPAMLLIGIAAKWILLGRLKEGDYPLWGSYYLRWLFVQRLLLGVPIHFLSGTPLMSWYLRLLGSKVGRDVHMDSHLISGLDLLAVGEGSTINSDANVSCYSVEDGFLKLRRVCIGKEVSIGIRSVIGQDVVIGDRTVVGDMTCIKSGQRLGAGEFWSGSPAARMEPQPCPLPPEPSAEVPVSDAAGLLFYASSFFVLPMLGLLPIFPGIMIMYELDYRTEDYKYLCLAPLVGLVFVVLSALQTLVLKWLILGRLKEGVHKIKSVFYMRKWFVDKLIETSLDMLRTLYATLYLNPWYRALGVKVGPNAEVSTAFPILPDLLDIGEGSFIADGAGLGPAQVSGGSIILRKTQVGSRTFIGNSAYVPCGSTLGANCLLGVQTTVPGALTPQGSSWVGSPPVNLPSRQKSQKQFAEQRTYHPTRSLYAQRLLIEFFRIILPSTAFVVFTTLILSFSVQIEDAYGPWVAVLSFPLLYIGLGVVSSLFTAAMKWVIIGRYKAGEHPLWSHFVWRAELMTGFCENFTNELFVQHLQGTAFLAWYFRLLGMKIGRRACILTTDFTEFDLVRLGDDVALNEDCTIQTHLFEDRVLKIGSVEVGARASIGSYAVILYGSVLEDDVKVGDLSLVMKGERLYKGSRWAGSPVRNSAFS